MVEIKGLRNVIIAIGFPGALSMRHEEVVTTVRNDLTAALTYLPSTAIRKSFEQS